MKDDDIAISDIAKSFANSLIFDFDNDTLWTVRNGKLTIFPVKNLAKTIKADIERITFKISNKNYKNG
jgi:hypothetical protein